MDKCTWGNSQASINLITNILIKEDYKVYTPTVCRLLSKQLTALAAIKDISDKNTRETTLRMWHERFWDLVSSLPELVQTHVICVETGVYRHLLERSRERL